MRLVTVTEWKWGSFIMSLYMWIYSIYSKMIVNKRLIVLRFDDLNCSGCSIHDVYISDTSSKTLKPFNCTDRYWIDYNWFCFEVNPQPGATIMGEPQTLQPSGEREFIRTEAITEMLNQCRTAYYKDLPFGIETLGMGKWVERSLIWWFLFNMFMFHPLTGMM